MKTILIKTINGTVIVIVICVIIFVIWAFWFALNFHGENYKDSEKYIIHLFVDETITKIKEYKIEHPQYSQYEISTIDRVPYEFGYFTEIKYDGNANVTTSTRTSNSTWYDFRFCVDQCDAIVSCCIKLNQYPTRILLVGVTYSNGENKTINNFKEISRKENRRIKKAFETEILDKIFDDKWK